MQGNKFEHFALQFRLLPIGIFGRHFVTSLEFALPHFVNRKSSINLFVIFLSSSVELKVILPKFMFLNAFTK